MKDNGGARHYLGKWTPERGFEPVDLENLIVVPEHWSRAVSITTTNYDHVIAKFAQSVERSTKELEQLERELEQQARSKIEIAPGYRLLRFLGSIVPPAFRERELDALHADSIELYFERLSAADKWGARRVKWSMRGWMLWTVFSGAAGALLSMVTGEHKASK